MYIIWDIYAFFKIYIYNIIISLGKVFKSFQGRRLLGRKVYRGATWTWFWISGKRTNLQIPNSLPRESNPVIGLGWTPESYTCNKLSNSGLVIRPLDSNLKGSRAGSVIILCGWGHWNFWSLALLGNEGTWLISYFSCWSRGLQSSPQFREKLRIL